MQLAPLSPSIPQFTWEDVRVSFAPHQVERLKEAGLMDLAREMSAQGRVSSDELAAEPGRYLLCARGSRGVTKLLDKVGADASSSSGRCGAATGKRARAPCARWAEREGVEAHFVHSGGHAWPEDLERLSERSPQSRRCGCTPTARMPAPSCGGWRDAGRRSSSRPSRQGRS